MKKGTPSGRGEGGSLFSFILKNTIMAVYIVKEEKKMKIITVRPDQETYFQADYAGRILVRGDSTVDALLKFQELPDEVKFPDQQESSQ
jgi:hypothetical protein